jgi:hypothetical protein
MTGRPSDYTQELADLICQRLAQGESLRVICKEDELPAERTIYRWLHSHDGFCQQYARARKVWADSQLEEIIEIADTEKDAAIARVRIDTRKWAMGKLNGKYSDKVKHVGGDEGDNPIAFTGFDISFV